MAAVWPAGPDPMTWRGNVSVARLLAEGVTRTGRGTNSLTTLLCIFRLRVCNSLGELFLRLVAARAATQKLGAPDLIVRRANVENSLATGPQDAVSEEGADATRPTRMGSFMNSSRTSHEDIFW